MPRYFFDFHDGISEVDYEGAEFDGPDEARAAGVRLLSGIMQDDPELVKVDHEWAVCVREGPSVIFSVSLLVSEGKQSRREVQAS